MMKNLFSTLVALLLLFCACTTSQIDLYSEDFIAAAIDLCDKFFASDFYAAVEASNKEAMQNGEIQKSIVIGISRMRNETTQMIDMDQLVKIIRTKLHDSGQFVISTGVGLAGPEDPLVAKIPDELQKDPYVNTKELQGVIGKTMRVPTYTLTGKIIEQRKPYGRSGYRSDYYFQMTLTEVATRTSVWEGNVMILKR